MNKHWLILTLFAVYLSGLAGDAHRQVKQAENDEEITIIRVLYKSWQETVDVNLVDLKLKRSRIEYTYPSMISGTPSSSKTIKYPDRPLKQEDKNKLDELIRKSGFLSLKDAYGAPEGQRYYPYGITVYLSNGKSKSTLFRSNPDYEGKPPAFKKLEDLLKNLPSTEPSKNK